jgi:hypothetical protein
MQENNFDMDFSLSNYILGYVYSLLNTYDRGKRSESGLFISRKHARLIVANKLKVDRFLFDIIVSEMQKKGFLENRSRGIFIKRQQHEV